MVILTSRKSYIIDPVFNVESGIEISMCLKAAHPTAKRLLVRSVGSIDIMTLSALLGSIGTPHSCREDTPFGSIPGDLVGDVSEIGGAHVRIRRSGLVLHRRH
jgi:hypothetical protein